MKNLKRLGEIIRCDFAEDNNLPPTKKLNVEKLLESDFIDRFLGFVEAYDELFDNNVFDTCVTKWLEYSHEEYDCIKYFLHTSSSEYSFPFSINDFSFMSLSEIISSYEKCTKICALLDEKRALYEEFNTFYE